MKRKPHVIGKQVFEAEFNSTESGLVFRTEFTEMIKRSLLPIIEEVLDEFSPKNATVRIDKIELNLENISYPFDEFGIRELLRKKFRDELNFKIVSIRHKKNNSFQETDTIVSVKKTEEEFILFFLQEGYLPWWVSESKDFSISIEEIIRLRIKENPKSMTKILDRIKGNRAGIKRFLYHTSEPSFFYLLSALQTIPIKELEELKSYFIKEGFSTLVSDFGMSFKEFLFDFIITKKKKNSPFEELKWEFSEYLLEQNEIEEYQLTEVFLEKYLTKWVERNFPNYLILFKEYSVIIEQSMPLTDRRKAYKVLFDSFLKNISYPTSDLSERIAKDLRNYSEALAESVKKVKPMLVGEEEKTVKSIEILERLERSLLQYLQFGVISWEDRAAGVEGMENIFMKLHEQFPDLLKALFVKIPLSAYPSTLIRIENNFKKEITEITLAQYFSKQVALEQLASVQYRDQILRNFFSKGTAPWADVISNSIPYVEEIILSFYQKDPSYFIRILKEFDVQREIFLARIEGVFSNRLISLMSSLIDSIEQAKESEQSQTTEPPKDVDVLVYYLNYFEKHRKLPEEVAFSLEELMTVFLTFFPEESKVYVTMAAYSESIVLKEPFSPSLSSKIKSLIEEDSIDKRGKGMKEVEKKDKQLSKKDRVAEEKKQEEIKEPIYIANAGLILIHPFLQRFFSMCQLLEKRKFKDKTATHKAVHLLQYIVSKGEKREEHQLVLNKILCGVPLSEPIDSTIELTEEDKETCESLIRGVVENWPILKKTSNDNFRVSFLQREGKLTGDEATWRLKVEERSFDMLLDKLPWTISMIKLPWMEKVLHVEWR